MWVKMLKNSSIFYYFYFSAIVSLVVLYSINYVYSRPPWLKPGLYVEYRLFKASAEEHVLILTYEPLVQLGILHKYRIGNCTIYTDLEPNKFHEWVKRSNLNLMEIGKRAGDMLFIINSVEFNKRVMEAYKLGKIPKIPEAASTIRWIKGKYDILNASYSWRCLGFRKGLAEVIVKFKGWIRDVNTHEVKHLDLNFTVYIDPDTRKVFTKDEEYLGIVPFWISNLRVVSRVTVLSLRNHIINGTVDGETEVETPLGTFKAYLISRTDETLIFPRMEFLCFDRVKGILLSTRNYADPILLHFMNISYIHVQKMVISKLEYIEPPAKIIPQTWIVQVLGLIAIALVPIVIVIGRKKVRRG